jgi:hypothetical protein
MERVMASSSPVEELAKLTDMLEKGLLSREEFDLMKAKVIGRLTNPGIPVPDVRHEASP